MGAWFPMEQGGEMFNLESLGKIHVLKGNTQKHMPFPHAFMFSSSLMFWGAAIRFDHPSFMFSVFFPCFACPVHHLSLTKTLWSILIVLYSILCMHDVRLSCLQKHVLFWVVHRWYPQCCCAMVSSVTEWVEACFAVLTLWSTMCAYFSLVWTGFECNWI